jgi:branched-chain amino acid transport system substrate-binding protein
LPTLISPACAAALGAAALLIGPARAEDTFKIGTVLPMTSGQASTGKQ